jgi:hypothetical protein
MCLGETKRKKAAGFLKNEQEQEVFVLPVGFGFSFHLPFLAAASQIPYNLLPESYLCKYFYGSASFLNAT